MSAERLVVTVVSGLFVVGLGALIRCREMVSLVAGYSPDEVTDEEGLANFIGTLAIITGIGTVLAGVLDYRGIADGLLWYVFGAFVIGVVGLLLVGSNRYTR